MLGVLVEDVVVELESVEVVVAAGAVASGALVESAGAVLAFVEDAPESMLAGAVLVSVLDVVVVVELAGGGFVASVSELLLQPTSVKGKARVNAARREYFREKLFMDAS